MSPSMNFCFFGFKWRLNIFRVYWPRFFFFFFPLLNYLFSERERERIEDGK